MGLFLEGKDCLPFIGPRYTSTLVHEKFTEKPHVSAWETLLCLGNQGKNIICCVEPARQESLALGRQDLRDILKESVVLRSGRDEEEVVLSHRKILQSSLGHLKEVDHL